MAPRAKVWHLWFRLSHCVCPAPYNLIWRRCPTCWLTLVKSCEPHRNVWFIKRHHWTPKCLPAADMKQSKHFMQQKNWMHECTFIINKINYLFFIWSISNRFIKVSYVYPNFTLRLPYCTTQKHFPTSSLLGSHLAALMGQTLSRSFL